MPLINTTTEITLVTLITLVSAGKANKFRAALWSWVSDMKKRDKYRSSLLCREFLPLINAACLHCTAVPCLLVLADVPEIRQYLLCPKQKIGEKLLLRSISANDGPTAFALSAVGIRVVSTLDIMTHRGTKRRVDFQWETIAPYKPAVNAPPPSRLSSQEHDVDNEMYEDSASDSVQMPLVEINTRSVLYEVHKTRTERQINFSSLNFLSQRVSLWVSVSEFGKRIRRMRFQRRLCEQRILSTLLAGGCSGDLAGIVRSFIGYHKTECDILLARQVAPSSRIKKKKQRDNSKAALSWTNQHPPYSPPTLPEMETLYTKTSFTAPHGSDRKRRRAAAGLPLNKNNNQQIRRTVPK
jgi:hypothetical protein